MSFEIEFTGSLVDNRNLPEVTTVSTLNRNVNDLLSAWEFSGFGTVPFTTIGGYPTTQAGGQVYSGEPAPQAGLEAILESNTGYASFYNPQANFPLSASQGWHFLVDYNESLYNQLNLQFRTGGSVANWIPSYFTLHFLNAAGSILQTISVYNWTSITAYPFNLNGSLYSHNQNYSPPAGTVKAFFSFYNGDDDGLKNGVQAGTQMDYIRMYGQFNGTVSATPSTITQGVQKVGGTFATETIIEEQAGRPDLSEPPSLHGLIAKDGANTITKSTYLPAAADSSDAKKDVKSVKIITTQTDTLTTEAIGLGGSETLDAKSSILVEDVEAKGEN